MSIPAPSSVDEYLDNVSSDPARASLAAIRAILREEVPEGEESIKYGIPTVKFHGYVASFAAYKNHCSFFAGHTVAEFTEELKPFKTSKGTVQFLHDKPLPEALVRAMIRARVAENLAHS